MMMLFVSEGYSSCRNGGHIPVLLLPEDEKRFLQTIIIFMMMILFVSEGLTVGVVGRQFTFCNDDAFISFFSGPVIGVFIRLRVLLAFPVVVLSNSENLCVMGCLTRHVLVVIEIVEETWRRPRVRRKETRRVDSKWQDSSSKQQGAARIVGSRGNVVQLRVPRQPGGLG